MILTNRGQNYPKMSYVEADLVKIEALESEIRTFSNRSQHER